MMKTHLQEQTLDAWREASDDEIISALNDPPPFISPFFMAYCKAERPNCLHAHLHAIRVTGGHVGMPARSWENGT